MSLSLSLIIPTHNRAAHLQSLLEQIRNQTQPPEQVIVVDDHSTDATMSVVKQLAATWSNVAYFRNLGHHQRDAKATALAHANGEYYGFLDDDAVIEDPTLFQRLRPLLRPDTVTQTKIILEQMGKKNLPTITWKDRLATQPYPILELVTTNLNRGTQAREIFPIIEWGNFWHKSLKDFFIDDNLIKDAYGESYSASVQLYRADIKLIMQPALVIRHPGAQTGGSHKFNKKSMVRDFTEFHYGYFYNMIYLHSRFFLVWIWLWLPYFYLKSLVALAINGNLKGWRDCAIKPIRESLRKNLATTHPPAADKTSIFVWQGSWHGGAERVTLSMAEHLAAKGCNVTLGVYQKNPNINLSQITFPKFLLIPQSFRPLAASLIFCYRYAQNFSAVYAHTLGAWSTKNNHLFIHDAADLDKKLMQTQGILHQLAYRLWRILYLSLCLRRATILFSATHEFAQYLKRHNIPHDHIVPSSSFYNEQIYHYIERPKPALPVKIIFIGNYRDPAKNFAAVRRLFHDNPEYIVTVMGGPAPDRDRNIIYRGHSAGTEVQRALAEADIFFMPSISEGFSMALLEALATGIPCLVNQSAIPSPLKNIASLISYTSEDHVQQKIDHLIENYSHYNTFPPTLKQFAQSTVLQKEYETIKKYLTLASNLT